MSSNDTAHLVLADGRTFTGRAFGFRGTTTGEAVFTTGMTGYEEVLTDPSYAGQLVCMTSPHIGNTGTNDQDAEAVAPKLAGYIVHAEPTAPSNWRSKESLPAYLERHRIVGISGVDTRALTRHLRDVGSQIAAIGTAPIDELRALARDTPPMTGRDLATGVSTKAPYEWTEGNGAWAVQSRTIDGAHVVAVDYGTKLTILRCLVDAGFRVTVVPAKTSAAEILARSPDGVFLSNGPGDPAAVSYAVSTIRELIGKKPIFGICLGHQLLSLALGAKTYKLKFGHRGLNQPVKDLTTGRVEVTTQNHGFCVDVASLPKTCRLTHVHLNDDSCEGFELEDGSAFAVQYHPEAGAGPHDARYLFTRFAERVTRAK